MSLRTHIQEISEKDREFLRQAIEELKQQNLQRTRDEQDEEKVVPTEWGVLDVDTGFKIWDQDPEDIRWMLHDNA